MGLICFSSVGSIAWSYIYNNIDVALIELRPHHTISYIIIIICPIEQLLTTDLILILTLIAWGAGVAQWQWQ